MVNRLYEGSILTCSHVDYDQSEENNNNPSTKFDWYNNEKNKLSANHEKRAHEN